MTWQISQAVRQLKHIYMYIYVCIYVYIYVYVYVCIYYIYMNKIPRILDDMTNFTGNPAIKLQFNLNGLYSSILSSFLPLSFALALAFDCPDYYDDDLYMMTIIFNINIWWWW
jgi:hypothetical protein